MLIRVLSSILNLDWLSICKFVKMAFNSCGVIFIAEYNGCIILHVGLRTVAACCSSCTRASIGHRLWIVSKSQQRLLQNNIRQDLPLFNSYEQFLPILHFCLFGCIEEYVCATFVILGDQYSPQLLVNLHVQNISSEYWKRKAHVAFPRNKLDSLHRTYFLCDKECMSFISTFASKKFNHSFHSSTCMRYTETQTDI